MDDFNYFIFSFYIYYYLINLIICITFPSNTEFSIHHFHWIIILDNQLTKHRFYLDTRSHATGTPRANPRTSCLVYPITSRKHSSASTVIERFLLLQFSKTHLLNLPIQYRKENIDIIVGILLHESIASLQCFLPSFVFGIPKDPRRDQGKSNGMTIVFHG